MKTLRALALAATLAAVCVLPAMAGPDGDPGPCVPGTPSCPLTPPQSIQVNPHPLHADGTSVEVPASGGLEPVEVIVPMPAPAFVDPLVAGSEGAGDSADGASGSGNGASAEIAGSDGDLLMGAEEAGSSGVGSATAGSVGAAQALALAGLGAMSLVATASQGLTRLSSGLGRWSSLGRPGAGSVTRGTRLGGYRGAGPRGGNGAPKEREERMLPRATWVLGANTATSGQGGAVKALYSIVPPPTPTPIVQTPTPTDPVPTPTYGPGTPTQTEGPQATPTPTPSPSSTPTYDGTGQERYSQTPTASNTPTPYYQALITPGTPVAVATQVPGAWATQIAEGKVFSQASERGLRLKDSLAKLGGITWPRNYQLPGLISSALAMTGLWRQSNGASEQELQGYRLGGRVSDWAGSLGLAAYTRNLAGLPTAGQIIKNAAQVAAGEGDVFSGMKGFVGGLAKGAGKELAAIGGHVVPQGLSLTNLAIRGLQIAGSFGGVVAGWFQAKEGLEMMRSPDKGDRSVGAVQRLGGFATIGGSAITLAGAVGLISAPVILGAAPVLLGAGAIAAAGTLAYKYLKDKEVDKSFERWVSQPGGFEDTAIKAGQKLKGGLDAWGGIAHNAGIIARTLKERASNAGAKVLAAAGSLASGWLKKESGSRPKTSFSLPKVNIPKIALPKVTLPKITLPKISPPKMTLPKITLPKVTLPKVTLPKITLPKITLPKTAPAKITAPKVTSSKTSSPRVKTSRPSPPKAKPAPKPARSLGWRR